MSSWTPADAAAEPIISAWAVDGSSLAVVGKDQAVRWLDARVADAVVGTAQCAASLRPAEAIPLSLTEPWLWLVLGANKGRQPAFQVIDNRRPDAPLVSDSFEGLSVGALLPKYDIDTKLLYMAQKGSSTLYAFDCSSVSEGRPARVDAAPVKGGVQGLAALPKQCVNVMGCEVARLYKLSNNSVSTISVSVERKAVQFHEDLFPPTASNKPHLSAADFKAGANSLPYLLSPDPAKQLFARAENVDFAKEVAVQSAQQQQQQLETKKADEKKVRCHSLPCHDLIVCEAVFPGVHVPPPFWLACLVFTVLSCRGCFSLVETGVRGEELQTRLVG